MERQIAELSKRFYNALDDADILNKTILLSSYKVITNFISLNKQLENKETLTDLLKKYENKAYISKGKPLTDKQIIRLEFKRIKQEYEKQKSENNPSDISKMNNLNDNSNLEIKNHLLILVDYYISQLQIFKDVDKLSEENIEFLKKRIAYIEILLNMKNGLYYETFLCFLAELERIEKINNLNKIEIKKETNIDNINNSEKMRSC